MNNVDKQYLDLLQDIIDNGVYKETRSGAVRSVFGRNMRFNLQEGLPLLTTKKVFTKGVIYELLWFLKGDTNIEYLVDNNVHIWNDDAYRYFKTINFKYFKRENDESITGYYKWVYCVFKFHEIECNYSIRTEDDDIPITLDEIKNISKEQFIDYVKQGAYMYRHDMYKDCCVASHCIYKFGDLNDVYGKQWRRYGGSGKDQIQSIIDTLKTDPDDRRMILNGWNPDVLDKVALPACHCFAQFYSRPLNNMERLNWLCRHSENHEYDEWKTTSTELLDTLNVPKRALSCSFTVRSQDFFLGASFNLLSYAILTHMIAQCCDMAVDELIYNGGDVHLYESHMDAANEQLARDPHKYDSPKLRLNPEIKNIDYFNFNDIEIINYESYPTIKAPLSVGRC